MKNTKRAHGDEFEDLARLYLEQKGLKMLGKNILYPCGEIDWVGEESVKGKLTLVFVEVRKRDPRSWIRAEETLTYPKQRTLRNAVQRYLLSYRGPAQELRIDLIAFDDKALKHFKDFMRA